MKFSLQDTQKFPSIFPISVFRTVNEKNIQNVSSAQTIQKLSTAHDQKTGKFSRGIFHSQSSNIQNFHSLSPHSRFSKKKNSKEKSVYYSKKAPSLVSRGFCFNR
jgi:hypothetical protein